ncbi:nucleotide exchange factor GrpE [Lentzea guizhouensis]|uniref:Nucleotide exchange factor GrpE n=1 Tax=Lentzea guizhouensis TaxID=1586287 RepID=A0A1B2HU90_9PSEU|nr:nucleotide exchange factor GrpE [Lentzea guizhouensis]
MASNDDTEQSGRPDDRLAELVAITGELVEQTRAHHVRAAAREKVIDNLHEEVQRLRVGEQALLLRPLVVDLQTLRNDLLRQARTVPEQLSARQAADLLESFALSVEQTLERCGCTPVRPEPGTPFSARDHRAVKVVAAASAEEDSTIAEVVADGYHDANLGRVTSPARVHVRKWPGAAAEDPPERAGNGATQQEKGEEGV